MDGFNRKTMVSFYFLSQPLNINVVMEGYLIFETDPFYRHYNTHSFTVRTKDYHGVSKKTKVSSSKITNLPNSTETRE